MHAQQFLVNECLVDRGRLFGEMIYLDSWALIRDWRKELISEIATGSPKSTKPHVGVLRVLRLYRAFGTRSI